MIKISPKAVSTIFNTDCVEVHVDGNKIYWYTREGGIARSHMNVYEFMHRCKKWALENGYELTSRISEAPHSPACNAATFSQYIDEGKWLKGRTEPEAVARALEWIMEQKEKNDT